jgi:hypothetical protein
MLGIGTLCYTAHGGAGHAYAAMVPAGWLLMIWRYRHGLTICHRDQRKRQYPDGQQQPAPGMQVLAYPVQGEHFVYSTR